MIGAVLLHVDVALIDVVLAAGEVDCLAAVEG